MTKILVTGSREIRDKEFVESILEEHINKKRDIIIHGGASGVDHWVEAWCLKNLVTTKVVRPIFTDKKDYYLHRNAEMIGMCEEVLAIWNEKSRGTKFTIEYAKARSIPVIIKKKE